MLTFDELKQYQRAHRESFPDNLGLRVHRSLSWLQRAEQTKDDVDGKFIFLWIAFNAAYANDVGRGGQIGESTKFKMFLEKVCLLDHENRLSNLIWTQYSGDFRILLNNQYVFQPFWDAINLNSGDEDWTDKLAKQKAAAHAALGKQDIATLLSILFANLYTLRNQLMHGGATWNSGVNREQLTLGTNILEQIVPVIIDTMMRNPNTLWGEAFYPVVT